MKNIYTLREVAKKLRVSDRTIFRYLRQGKIRGSKIGDWRFTDDDIKRLLDKYKNYTPRK